MKNYIRSRLLWKGSGLAAGMAAIMFFCLAA